MLVILLQWRGLGMGMGSGMGRRRNRIGGGGAIHWFGRDGYAARLPAPPAGPPESIKPVGVFVGEMELMRGCAGFFLA